MGLARALKQPADFYVIRVVGDPQPLVLEAKAVAAAQERIRQRYGLSQTAYLKGGIVPKDWQPEEK